MRIRIKTGPNTHEYRDIQTQENNMRHPVTWAYGVTTVPSRRETLLPRTLASLKAAGFDQPRLFIDGWNETWPEVLLPQTLRHPAVRIAGNWVLSLQELLIREPLCERYAVFQDDILAVKNLRSYLDSIRMPDKVYWNLYTFPQNQQGSPGKGFYDSAHRGLGALGLVFSREGAMRLLSDYQIVARPTNQHRGHHNIDGGISEAMRRAGYKEQVHDPSLLFHIGEVSASGHQPYASAKSFPGEDFDAMTLLAGSAPTAVHPRPQPLSQPQGGLGDQVEKALSVAGITKERVERWLGRPCKCRERQEKLNALSGWVKRVLSGKTEEAGAHIDYLTGESG